MPSNNLLFQQLQLVIKYCFQKHFQCNLPVLCVAFTLFIFISRRALAREGDYEMMSVCACVCALVTQISPKLLQLQIFCKLIVPMNFHALENFFGFIDLGLKISE